MKLAIYPILFLALFTGCGADGLKNTSVKNTTAAITTPGSQCACTSEYFPVCGNDGKDYENICLATCMGHPPVVGAPQGACQCRDNVLVCAEGVTYTECNAVRLNKKISKFVACDVTPL